MDNKNDGNTVCGPNGSPSLLSIDNGVFLRDAKFILEYACSRLEADSMVAKILPRLFRVPFEKDGH